MGHDGQDTRSYEGKALEDAVSEERTPKGAWGITGLLFSFMLINFADKTVVGLAAVPIMRDLDLHTVCEEAHCPNVGECWEHGTATFMILGDVCTRNCAYCAVAHGRPPKFDPAEPERVAEAAATMKLQHVVLTSVDRDDLPDFGAWAFADTFPSYHAVPLWCSAFPQGDSASGQG